MPFCPHCGKPASTSARFCEFCGERLVNINAQSDVFPFDKNESIIVGTDMQGGIGAEPQIVQERIADTSRLSGVGVDKFISPDERIIFGTKSQVWFGNHQRKAYVTNRRVIFYRVQPKLLGIIKNDRLDEIYVNQIRKITLVEKGLIAKSIVLHLDELMIKGDRGDFIDLYKAIQSVRH